MKKKVLRRNSDGGRVVGWGFHAREQTGGMGDHDRSRQVAGWRRSGKKRRRRNQLTGNLAHGLMRLTCLACLDRLVLVAAGLGLCRHRSRNVGHRRRDSKRHPPQHEAEDDEADQANQGRSGFHGRSINVKRKSVWSRVVGRQGDHMITQDSVWLV